MKNQTESSRFLDLAKRVVSVPKVEIDKRDAQWKKSRATKKSEK
jgi:hypothetical protein